MIPPWGMELLGRLTSIEERLSVLERMTTEVADDQIRMRSGFGQLFAEAGNRIKDERRLKMLQGLRDAMKAVRRG